MRTPLPTQPPEGRVAGPAAAEREPRPTGSAVFVSDFVHVDASLDELLPVLLDPRACWLHDLAEPATAGAAPPAAPRAVVRIGIGSHEPPVPVLVCLGSARRRPDGAVVPLSWTSLGYPLVPDLDADLDLSVVDPATCRLGLSGRYRRRVVQPPADRTVGRIEPHPVHDVAETAVRDFLREVQRALTESARGNLHT